MYSPCNKNASPEVRSVLDYLNKIRGSKLITGQHTQTNPQEELSYIRSVTGKSPALLGFELLSYSPNINYSDASSACLTEVYENRGTLKKAYEWADLGGLITLSWHWFSPVGGRDKSFYSEHTDFDPEMVLLPQTPERQAFYSDMSVIADELSGFLKRHIPIIWRPFHEADGSWFWWGRKGAEVTAKLYRLMYDYFTRERKINNLIWVWNAVSPTAYVGDDCCDIISRDVYLPPHTHTDYSAEYDELIKITPTKKLTALAEVGTYPDIKAVTAGHTDWSYYMLWSKEFCSPEHNSDEVLLKLYENENAVTLENLPQVY